MTRLTDSLLRKAAQAASEHVRLNNLITQAFNERYGCNYSDVDCDALIDVLDYGGGVAPTVATCDMLMAECGINPPVILSDIERAVLSFTSTYGPYTDFGGRGSQASKRAAAKRLIERGLLEGHYRGCAITEAGTAALSKQL